MSDSESDETYLDTQTESESDDVNSDSDGTVTEVENDEEQIKLEDQEVGDKNCDHNNAKYDICNESDGTHATEKQDGNPSEFEIALEKALANEAAKAVGDMWNIIVTKRVEKAVEGAGNSAISNQSNTVSNENEMATPTSSKANDGSQLFTDETGANPKVVVRGKKATTDGGESNNDKPIRRKNVSTTKSKTGKELKLDDDSKVTAKKKTERSKYDMNTVEDYETKSSTKNSSVIFDSIGRGESSEDDDGYSPKQSKKKENALTEKSDILQDDLVRLAREYDGTIPTVIVKEAELNTTTPSSSTPTLPFSFAPSNKELEDIIDTGAVLYFWNDIGGSFMGYAASAMPLMLQEIADKSAKFCIVWVDSHASKVAIKSMNSERHERYISCGWKNPVTNSALACFSSSIGRNETFTMQKVNHSFIFQSHNHLFLHYNETYHSVAFKTCSERDKNGIPKKGRWTLLVENETKRVGTKSGLRRISYQVSFGWAKAAGRAAVAAAGREAAANVFQV